MTKNKKRIKKTAISIFKYRFGYNKRSFFIYITNIENPGYTLENYENVINKAIDSINFKYKYDSESLSFRESILYIKIFNEKENKTIEFKGLNEDKDDSLVNSSTFNNFSSELRKNQIILKKKEERLQSFEKALINLLEQMVVQLLITKAYSTNTQINLIIL